jgi:hypothetical protein
MINIIYSNKLSHHHPDPHRTMNNKSNYFLKNFSACQKLSNQIHQRFLKQWQITKLEQKK